jgi:hypothetical protein
LADVQSSGEAWRPRQEGRARHNRFVLEDR